ncbi:hypothetical protein AB0I68_28650 [Streptomyces sp. NPDC050448]
MRQDRPELLRAPAREVAQALPRAEDQTLPGRAHEVAAEALAPVLAAFFA